MSDVPPGDGDQASLIFGNFEPIEIQEEMERSFLDYSMSVITSRALPDVKDGLKPVQRRILWGMYDIGARPDNSLPGEGGIRIEDLVVITEGEPEVLYSFTKDLVDVS